MGLGAVGDVAESAVGSVGTSGPVVVQRSIKSCVVSSGRLSSMARPYRARLLSACRSNKQKNQHSKMEKDEARYIQLQAPTL